MPTCLRGAGFLRHGVCVWIFGCWQHRCKDHLNCKKNYRGKHRQWLQCSAWHDRRWPVGGGDTQSGGVAGGRHCSKSPAGTAECWRWRADDSGRRGYSARAGTGTNTERCGRYPLHRSPQSHRHQLYQHASVKFTHAKHSPHYHSNTCSVIRSEVILIQIILTVFFGNTWRKKTDVDSTNPGSLGKQLLKQKPC